MTKQKQEGKEGRKEVGQVRKKVRKKEMGRNIRNALLNCSRPKTKTRRYDFRAQSAKKFKISPVTNINIVNPNPCVRELIARCMEGRVETMARRAPVAQ